jgi:hypothetical protein
MQVMIEVVVALPSGNECCVIVCKSDDEVGLQAPR